MDIWTGQAACAYDPIGPERPSDCRHRNGLVNNTLVRGEAAVLGRKPDLTAALVMGRRKTASRKNNVLNTVLWSSTRTDLAGFGICFTAFSPLILTHP